MGNSDSAFFGEVHEDTRDAVRDAESIVHKSSRGLSKNPYSTNRKSDTVESSYNHLQPTVTSRRMITLRCLVEGDACVGKSSLVRRLRGDDIQNNNISEVRKKRMMALIPWKYHNEESPSVDPFLIQLHIVESHYHDSTTTGNLDSSTSRSLTTTNMLDDFVVIMVDPDRSGSFNYAKRVLERLCLTLKGAESSVKDSVDQNCRDSILPRLKMSVCILLNFRDRLTDAKASAVTLEHLKEMSDKLRDDYSLSDQLEICCFHSSMKNCYGLQYFNDFVRVPYLQRREYELMQEVSRVNDELKRYSLLLSKRDEVSYEEFETSYQLEQDKRKVVQISSVIDTGRHDGVSGERPKSNPLIVRTSSPAQCHRRDIMGSVASFENTVSVRSPSEISFSIPSRQNHVDRSTRVKLVKDIKVPQDSALFGSQVGNLMYSSQQGLSSTESADQEGGQIHFHSSQINQKHSFHTSVPPQMMENIKIMLESTSTQIQQPLSVTSACSDPQRALDDFLASSSDETGDVPCLDSVHERHRLPVASSLHSGILYSDSESTSSNSSEKFIYRQLWR